MDQKGTEMMDYIEFELAKQELAERRRRADQRRLASSLTGIPRPARLGRLWTTAAAALGGWMIEVGCRLQTGATEVAADWQSVSPTPAASSQPSRTGC